MKNFKTCSRHYFSPKRDEIGRKSENKILLQNFVHTRPGQGYSEKNSKKIQKIIKPLPSIICSQNGRRSAEKVRQNFTPEFRSYSNRARKFRKKNSKKIEKIIKPLPGNIFSQNGMRYTEKEKTKF